MVAPYTLDLRERVVAAFRSGISRFETAMLFKVSESSVQRWARLDREKGDLTPQPMGGHRPFALANERDRILERIAQQPDLPLRELLAEWQSRGIEVSYFAVWIIVDRAGLSFKKKPSRQRTGPPERCSPTPAMARTTGQNRSKASCFH